MTDVENRYDLDDTETHAPEIEYTEEEVQEKFEERYITDKEGILTQIDIECVAWESEMTRANKKYTEGFYRVLLGLLSRFRETVSHRKFFKRLEPSWCYSICIESTGISLLLEHYADARINENGEADVTFTDESYELIKVPSRLLLVEEYAEIYGVEPNTVRMWIRRGKLRTAIKYGREWRIPELTETPGRGYSYGQYRWDEDLADLPEEISYLRDYKFISLIQNKKDKSMFDITLMHPSKPYRSMTISQKERERLELYLISNPMVKFVSDTIEYVG